MVTMARTTGDGRQITEGAYQSHIKAGIDVSGYKSATPNTTPTGWNTPTTTPTTTPTKASGTLTPQQQAATDKLNAMRNSSMYTQLLWQGYDAATIDETIKKQTTSTPKQTDYKWLSGDLELQPIQGHNQWVQLYKGNPDYQDTSETRLNEISSNVRSFYQTNPQSFKNYDEFKKYFEYDQRVWQQKQILDSFWREKNIQISLLEWVLMI